MSEAKSWSRDNPMKVFEWLFFVPTSGQWAATFMFGVSICEEDKKAVKANSHCHYNHDYNLLLFCYCYLLLFLMWTFKTFSCCLIVIC